MRTHQVTVRAFGYRLSITWRLPGWVRYGVAPCGLMIGLGLGEAARLTL